MTRNEKYCRWCDNSGFITYFHKDDPMRYQYGAPCQYCDIGIEKRRIWEANNIFAGEFNPAFHVRSKDKLLQEAAA